MIFIIYLVAISFGVAIGFYLAKQFAIRSRFSASQVPIDENINALLSSAQSQREIILNEAMRAAKDQYAEEAERLEQDRNSILKLNENFDMELNQKQSEIDKFENIIIEKENNLIEKKEHLEKLNSTFDNLNESKELLLKDLESQLEAKGGIPKEHLMHQMQDDLVNTEKLGVTKWLMDNFETLKSDAQKMARESLSSVYLRYQPKFIWPKSSFVVNVGSKGILQKYFQEESPFIGLLTENTDTTLSVLTINDEMPSMIKIAGGAGVDKEIIRLTLEEMVAKEIFHPDKIKNIIEKNRRNIDKYVLSLGEEALKNLGLKNDMSPEILKLIGSLNYRTSHRQNQYYHSIEVARLAGMIADEIGVDSTITKRAGILHDIGKVLDYKIEGSHAVISADYATRFGENEVVVDTVLAHHDDKIVETPFAYILKAADALSGARPGARVDMEEGYNRRIDGISGVVNSFQDCGVTGSAIMHAGREVHVYVDNVKVKNSDINDLAKNIAEKLQENVEYPGQIRVTVIRRTEISEVA